ncbi:hypothetical protein [Streptomyces sp. NBC_01244]|uniref:hypothetical protein n=1 Tax=Streptomyces sp. NBC_01244 TaxID=2903797 RepID=UPI002E0EAC84|nr:hypothetical protein OG247_44690 [Streptomyces sp. NBC_01244]
MRPRSPYWLGRIAHDPPPDPAASTAHDRQHRRSGARGCSRIPGPYTLAAAAAGALALYLGVRTTLTIGALFQLIPVAILLLSPVRTMRDMPAPPPRPALPSAREGSP